jgi:hypothetical protein
MTRNCEHWQSCSDCKPEWFDYEGNRLPPKPAKKESLKMELAKLKRPDFGEMREMLRTMQAGELTVSRGIEILEIWSAGNWSDDMLPPVRNDLYEEDSMPVEIIDRLQTQLAAAQATLAQMRVALASTLGNMEEWAASNDERLIGTVIGICTNALAIPTDDTALRAEVAELRKAAQLFAEIRRRFSGCKTSESERVLEALGLEPSAAWMPLDEIINSAINQKENEK